MAERAYTKGSMKAPLDFGLQWSVASESRNETSPRLQGTCIQHMGRWGSEELMYPRNYRFPAQL
jgi:hypothetical protein